MLGDLRWGGMYGCEVDFVASENCKICFVYAKDFKVCQATVPFNSLSSVLAIERRTATFPKHHLDLLSISESRQCVHCCFKK